MHVLEVHLIELKLCLYDTSRRNTSVQDVLVRWQVVAFESSVQGHRIQKTKAGRKVVFKQ